jgi:transposase InsO family protein
VRVRFGYPRLTILLRREGWAVGKKLVYRLYRELGLEMRSKKRRKLASANRGLVERATQPNERWSMDFMTDRLEGGRYFRTLTVIDQFTRECLKLDVAHHMSGTRVVESLERVADLRGYPRSITVDNGTEFCSQAVDAWAYRNQVTIWREDYNTERPHNALANLPPAAFAASAVRREKEVRIGDGSFRFPDSQFWSSRLFCTYADLAYCETNLRSFASAPMTKLTSMRIRRMVSASSISRSLTRRLRA